MPDDQFLWKFPDPDDIYPMREMFGVHHYLPVKRSLIDGFSHKINDPDGKTQ